MAKSTKNKPKAEEVTEDEVELEELDADVEEDKPAKGKGKAKTPEVTFGASDLAKHLSKVMEKEISARDLRTLIRKMAREDNPRIQREIVAGNRSRYDWSGLDDPEVKAIIKAVKAGELEQGKKEALDKLKASKAEKTAAKKAEKEKAEKAAAKKGKGKKAAPVEDDDDEEIEIEVDED